MESTPGEFCSATLSQGLLRSVFEYICVCRMYFFDIQSVYVWIDSL